MRTFLPEATWAGRSRVRLILPLLLLMVNNGA
jgi:hypothetical protein